MENEIIEVKKINDKKEEKEKNNNKRKANLNHIINILIIVFIGIFISIPLFNGKLDIYRDDGIQHIIRIEEETENIKKLESSKIYDNLCNRFGYSWNIFYGNFTSFVPALLNVIIENEIISFEIFLSFILILSGISMYFCTYKMFEKKGISIISAIMYMTMPYHLNDMYIRYSIR